MLLPQPELHNANTEKKDTRLESVRFFRVVWLNYSNVDENVGTNFGQLSMIAWLMYHFSLGLHCIGFIGGGLLCSSSHCTMFCAVLCTA